MDWNGDSSGRKWRYPWPPKLIDKFFLSVVLLGGILLSWYEGFQVLPTYYTENPSSPIVVAHMAIFMGLLFHIYANMALLIFTDTSVRSRAYLPLVSQMWRFCQKCDTHVPARSHHCANCDVCILRRDHHCWFAGCCVGYHNQRYFCVMVAYMCIVALYCNIFNYEFVRQMKGSPFSFFNIASFVMPHVGWVLGYYDAYVFFVTVMSSVGFFILLMLLWLCNTQIKMALYAQTQYEYKKKINTYNMGFTHNLTDILGPRWGLVFICPWIKSELPGDGFVFSTKDS